MYYAKLARMVSGSITPAVLSIRTRQRTTGFIFNKEQKSIRPNGSIQNESKRGYQHLLSEWEEAIGYQLSQDKQSIYMEGVKDGMLLILPVIQSTPIR
ncbi:hypothetical protein [Paenibacillus polymyxa]|uniref:hypothetical protein n=1 Tax=Paenibacillus polymyxa TaxID=1406 RepID=UPI003D295731